MLTRLGIVRKFTQHGDTEKESTPEKLVGFQGMMMFHLGTPILFEYNGLAESGENFPKNNTLIYYCLDERYT